MERPSIWGERFDFESSRVLGGKLRRTHAGFLPIRAAVKRRKEIPFDNVIEREKKLKLVLKIRKILVSRPNRMMALRHLGKHRKELGLQKGRRFVALLKKFPAVFEVIEDGVYSLKFRLTPEAESLYLEEMKIRNEMEDILVAKLRKLLMMSLEKRIPLSKIVHLRADLGLPVEFRDTICRRYPQYFKMVSTDNGLLLELVHWDAELAVSAAEMHEEERRAEELRERNLIIDRPLKFDIVQLPKGLKVTKGEMRKLVAFKRMPYISPYSDFSGLQPGTREKEKHTCGVVHEILSLTLEKRTLVDTLTHFRDEFKFPQSIRSLIIRHPDMFYLSLKGTRDSVFLREAYRNSQLVDKDRLLLIKEKMRALVEVPRFPKHPRRMFDGVEGIKDKLEEKGEEEEDDDEDGEDWSDIENMLDEELGGDDDDEDWGDDSDDMPPDFDEDGNGLKVEPTEPVQQAVVPEKNEEEKVPAHRDGRPRERW